MTLFHGDGLIVEKQVVRWRNGIDFKGAFRGNVVPIEHMKEGGLSEAAIAQFEKEVASLDLFV